MLRAAAFLLSGLVLTASAAAQGPAAAPSAGAHMTIGRLQYDGGGDWYANPSSLPNLLEAIRTRTSLKVERAEARVRLTDESLWDFPFLHVTGPGHIRLR